MKTAIYFGSLLTFVGSVAPGCSTAPVFHHGDAGAEAISGSNSAGDEAGFAGKAMTGRGGAATGAGGTATGTGGDSGEAGGSGEVGDSAGCGSKSDPKNCGSCGHDCTTLTNVAPGATVECQGGLCYVPAPACLPGFGHCSSKPDDGCEANLSDPDNCGTCSVQCSGATALCSAADGGSQCSATCKGAAADVCASSCVSIKSDPRNCGTCGHDCTALANVSPNASGIECRASVCYVPPNACLAGFGHCSSRADDGCEVELKTPTNCGACGKACTAPTALCSTTASTVGCSSSCVAPSPNLCGVKCVDVKSDASNCGTCGHDCLSLPNVKAGATGVECRSGACYVPSTACTAGHAHCSALADDGCEADLSSPQHCGTCSLSCNGTTPLCSTQTQPAKCLPSCSGSSPDICGTGCVSLATDPKNCGSCGHTCSTLPNVKPGAIAPAVQCVAGACVLQPAACVSGFGHCGSDPNSGCETDLTQPKTCGSCSNACTAPTGLCSTTNGAVCSSSCVSPNPDLCTSKCVNKANDPGNCGTCGHDCASLPKLKSGAAVSCSAGGCVVPSGTGQCQSGYANCSAGGADTDGCETQLTSVANCGACGHNCASLPNLKSGASVSCTSSGGCSVPTGSAQCASGFGNCVASSNDTDGCETRLDTTANCGACGNACPTPANSTPACTGGSCTFSCKAGFSLCGRACVSLNDDGANCGACGHSCLGGACSQGTCQPATVATGIATAPNVFGLDASNVYFQANDFGSLNTNNAWFVSKSATLGSPTLILGEVSFATFPEVIGSNMYIRSKGFMGPASFTKCAISNCVLPTTPFTQTGDVISSRAATTYFNTWFTNAAQDTLSFTAWDSSGGGRPHNEAIVASGLSSLSTFAAGSSVYWIFDNGTSWSLFGVDMTTNTRVQLAGNLEAGSIIVDVNAASVLILGRNTNNLSRVPLPLGKGNAAPTALTAVGGPLGSLTGATEDASHVYWLDSAGTVSSCVPATCNATTAVLAVGQTSASGFFNDTTALYWGRASPSSVMRLAK